MSKYGGKTENIKSVIDLKRHLTETKEQIEDLNVIGILTCLYLKLNTITFDIKLMIQSTLTYPDTSVPKSIVRITEYPDKWVTLSIYNHDWNSNLCPDKWIIRISGVLISEASLYLSFHYMLYQILGLFKNLAIFLGICLKLSWLLL